MLKKIISKPMQSLLCTSTALLAPLFVQGLGTDPDLFFKPSEINNDLPEDQYYPRGKKFLFTFYSLGAWIDPEIKGLKGHLPMPEPELDQAFKEYKEAGLEIFGPQYEMNGRMLQDARKYGLEAIYSLRYPVNFHDNTTKVVIDADEIRKTLREMMEPVLDAPEIKFWYLQPEELRPWRKNEMQFLEYATTAIREIDPHKRPIMMYDPAHASAGRLASIAPWIDYLAKGMYVNYASKRDDRIWVRWSMEQELKAIERSGSKATPLALPEMYHDSRKGPFNVEDIALIPSWVRHDSYLSLVSGAKGIMVFSLRRRPSMPEEAWVAYRDAYFKVAKELIGEQKLGQVFLFGELRSEIIVDVIEGPEELQLVYPSGGVKEPLTYSSVNFLDVAYGKDRYLFLVNSANEPVRIMVGGLPYAAAVAETLFDDDAAFDIGEGEFEAELAPLEVKAYRFTRK